MLLRARSRNTSVELSWKDSADADDLGADDLLGAIFLMVLMAGLVGLTVDNECLTKRDAGLASAAQ